MAQVIQELIPQTSSLVRPRNKTCNVQKFDRNGASSLVAASVVRFALVRNVESCACAFYLEVTDGALRVDGGETESDKSETRFKIMRLRCITESDVGCSLAEESTYGKFPIQESLYEQWKP